MLLHAWPVTDSEKRINAMKACLEVIKGEKPPKVARRAFVVAANDARVYIG